MKRNYLVLRDKNFRKNFSKFEYRRMLLKFLKDNTNFSRAFRGYSTRKFNKISKNASKVYVVNRCVYTNRASWVYRFCKLSRIELKRQASFGFMCGVRRSSW